MFEFLIDLTSRTEREKKERKTRMVIKKIIEKKVDRRIDGINTDVSVASDLTKNKRSSFNLRAFNLSKKNNFIFILKQKKRLKLILWGQTSNFSSIHMLVPDDWK